MSKYAGWRDADLTTQLKQSIKMAKANKYNAKRVQIDGIWFDSKAEAKRYNELKLMRAAKLIVDLKVHPSLKIPSAEFVNMPQICTVELDFYYFDFKTKLYVWEDVKGRDNPLSKLKRKLVEAFYGIKVEVVK